MKRLQIIYIGTSDENSELLQTSSEAELIIAKNALEADQFFRTVELLDAIICETPIAGGDAFEIYQWVRERPKFNSIPFILVASDFNAETFRKAFKKRVDDFFVTPMPKAEDLIARIDFLKYFRDKTDLQKETEPQRIAYKMPFTKRLFDVLLAFFTLLFCPHFYYLLSLPYELSRRGKCITYRKELGVNHLISTN